MNAWLRWGIAVALCALVACGDDDDDDDVVDFDAAPAIDATPSPDAALAEFCLDSDTVCGYTPEPVMPADISLVDQAVIAERFNPAHVFTHDHIWSVSLDYLLEQSVNGLEQAEHDGRLNFSYDVNEGTRQAVAPQPDLMNDNWSTLPTTTGGGADLVYFADVVGDNDQNVDGDSVVGNGYDDESWSSEWVSAQGGSDADPTTADYPPVQYAHFFWLSKADRLLGIQYWFYYPYDKFTNNHEGDWEHINVVVRYLSSSDITIEGAQMSHHGAQGALHVDELIRLGDRDAGDGDHVVVFTGGDSCQNFIPDEYCGRASGASLPWPGVYTFSTIETVAGGATRAAGRAIHANDIGVILLPRIEDMDFDANPNMSWYALPFIGGQPTVQFNAPAVVATDNHRAPVGPNAAHDEYDVGIEQIYDYATQATPEAFVVPGGWTLIADPSQSF
jgi:hypothetical protein